MAKGREHFALDWIKSELLETLNGSREALEAYAESDRDETRMRTCLTCLHQVHGTLVMLELAGATLLADHLERLAQQLLNGLIDDEQGAGQSLMQGILELPGYLDEIQRGLPDSTEPMMPLVNEIRRRLGEPPLEISAAVTELGVASEAALERFEGIDGSDKAKKIRAAYQQVLLSILKGEDRARAVQTLKKVAQGLCRVCQGSPHEMQWRAFGEFVASLGTADGPLDGDAVKLLRRVDSEIRELVQQGVGALKNPVSVDLVKKLLEACQQRGYKSDILSDLRDTLTRTGHSDGLAISGREALASAAAALREELALVKDQLDLYARSHGKSSGARGDSSTDLAALIAPLKQIGSTLSLLGFASSKSIIADQIDTINSVVEAGVVEPQMLFRIASALVQVDENLASFTEGKAEVEKITSDAQKAVAVEARAGLEHVKQAIVDYISSQWDTRHLEGAPEQIAGICGALDMIPLPRAARLLSSCSAYVREELIGGDTPTWEQLDLLADAISGVDYYLERLAEETSGGSEDILHLVQRSLASLGYADARDESIESPAPEQSARAESETAADAPAPAVPDQEPSAGQEPEAAEEPDALEEIGLEEEPKLEMDTDTGFDLSDDMFNELDVDSASTPTETEETTSDAIESDVEPQQHDAQQLAEPANEVADTFADSSVVDIGIQTGPTPSIAAKANTLVDVFESDDEIIEIFVEEVAEVLENVVEWLPRWREEPTHEEALSEVRRAFHTLKGSGRIVGANIIGELAWSVENMLNRIIDATLEPTAAFALVVEEAVALIPYLRDAFETQQAPDMDGVARIMERADVLASGGELDDGAAPLAGQAPAESGKAPAADAEPDPLDLFVAETDGHLAVLAGGAHDGYFTFDDERMRALHTIAGSAAMAGIGAIDDLARPSYELALALRGHEDTTRLDGEAAAFFQQVLEAFSEIVDALRERRQPEEPLQLIAEVDRLLVATQSQEEAGGEALMALPALSVVMDAPDFLTHWRDGAMDLEFVEKLFEALGEIASVARQTSRPQIEELAVALRSTHEFLEHESLTDESYDVLALSQERLLEQFDALASGQTPARATAQITALHQLTLPEQAPAASEQEPAESEREPAFEQELPAVEAPVEEIEAAVADSDADDNVIDFPDSIPVLEPASADTDAATSLGGLADDLPQELAAEARNDPPAPIPEAVSGEPTESLVPDDIDEEIIDIFFEEADELLENMDQSAHDWAKEPVNRLHLENLLRGLHTLKGGARLSGFTILGDRTHQLESFLVDVQRDSAAVGADFFANLSARYDDLAMLVAQIREAVAVRMGTLVAQPPLESKQGSAAKDGSAGEASAEQVPDEASAERVPDEAPAAPRGVAELADEPAEEGPDFAGAQQAVKADRGKEMVRVGAGLLEKLVNLAGESSIVRARIEQGMSDFTGALDEMETTIERVREQLRRLEMETEAQILFRKDSPDGPSYDDFDPLEMDRYSQLQQLSRGLSESASDMLDLKDTLLFKARESETLLLQQARINTELQEGLMRTRMVPFSSLLPRLRRIVRQVSRELKKEVEFHAHNVEGELDRNLLERMISPLEHMLRNAVDHGIESAELRSSYGKPKIGRIDLQLSREGGDVVIEISDDGAGIDVESVRAKAVERGLIVEGATLQDEEINQFVLEPGFTTAKTITQISGRGVGMDVVHSEVKQLGGSINIVSRPGKGTRFIVRVPFTVSVNRALMVLVGDDLYAIPLNTIEGIVLLSTEELEKLYAPESNTFEYAGIPYQVRYLGHYLGREFRSSGLQGSVPVVLVRSGDHYVAVHVDAVQGSREIVVKSLGPQFAGVGGISGATILGDGSVVVILDLLALIRAQSSDGLLTSKRPIAGADRKCVMVVDDSVTVRKVTSRLLERQGIEVIVAKDGIEAIAMLQEKRPDVMLLDIEMPRMDGFEVARQVRRDDRLHDLPIIMISSRTGEKHQEHAAKLGVKNFLGKPFQENELLAIIDELVN